MKQLILILAILAISSWAFADPKPPKNPWPPSDTIDIPMTFKGDLSVVGDNIEICNSSDSCIIINPSNLPASTTAYNYGTYVLTAPSTSLTYVLTNSAAEPTGTVSLEIDQPGTYLLSGMVATTLKATAAYAAAEQMTCYLYRTNNTAATISYSTITVPIPIITAGGADEVFVSVVFPAISYTTSNSDDDITAYCGLTTVPAVANHEVTTIYIQSVRVGG